MRAGCVKEPAEFSCVLYFNINIVGNLYIHLKKTRMYLSRFVYMLVRLLTDFSEVFYPTRISKKNDIGKVNKKA